MTDYEPTGDGDLTDTDRFPEALHSAPAITLAAPAAVQSIENLGARA